MEKSYFWNPSPVYFLQVEARIQTQISLAQVSHMWQFFTAQILLLSGMDAQRDICCTPDPSKAAGRLVTASPCMTLVIKPEGALHNTSVRTFTCLFFPRVSGFWRSIIFLEWLNDLEWLLLNAQSQSLLRVLSELAGTSVRFLYLS